MTVLQVTNLGHGRVKVSYPTKPESRMRKIEAWIKAGLSAGYIEYLLRFGVEPHCSACRDRTCENVGNGDDACKAFKYGDEW